MASTIGHPARPGQVGNLSHAHPETEAKRLGREGLDALRRSLAGRAAHCHGSRSATYRQAQQRGEHPWTIDRDMPELAIEAPLAFVAWVRPLAARAGHQVVPFSVAGPAAPVPAVQGALDAAAALVNEVLSALADGHLDDEERGRALERAYAAQRALCAVVGNLQRSAA